MFLNDYEYNERKKIEERKLNQVLEKISKSGLSNLSETIQLMAQAENLEGHKKAVSIRFK